MRFVAAAWDIKSVSLAVTEKVHGAICLHFREYAKIRCMAEQCGTSCQVVLGSVFVHVHVTYTAAWVTSHYDDCVDLWTCHSSHHAFC